MDIGLNILDLIELTIIVFGIINILIYNKIILYTVKKLSHKEINKTIMIYEKSNEILKISNADFIVFFKYNYSKSFITKEIVYVINHTSSIKNFTYSELPISMSTFSIEILKLNDEKLHEIYPKDYSKDHMNEIYENVNKVYLRNLFKNKKYPMGYLVLAYYDDKHIKDVDQQRIIKIVNELKILL